MRGFGPMISTVLFAAILLAGCGSSGPALGEAAAKPPGKPTAQELYREFLLQLNSRNGAGVCALFTVDGAASFTRRWEATTCEGAVDRAATKFGDLQREIQNAEAKYIKEKNGVAEIGFKSCPPGLLSAKQTENGWLIFDYGYSAARSCSD